MAEPDLDFSGYFLVLGGLVNSQQSTVSSHQSAVMSDELLMISQKLTIDHSASPKGQGPIGPGLMMYTSQGTIQESKI
ncbi:hypothetical protein QUA74_17815 [Microcoleus sp. LAD1_D3]|uniref:hypothetical protein n=1 Tax=Microcoleus sp. LAD1_D3 TaxID=2819365 RepID=UPI002FD5C33B